MTKQLVVVVHGVGVNHSGQVTDQLSATIENTSRLPTSVEDFEIPEHTNHDIDDKKQTSPCRLKTYKSGKNSRIYADFYWGDISHIGTGVFGLIYAIFTLILGLSHPIRENARDVYREFPLIRGIIHLIVKIIHGPIVAMNLVFLGGIFIAWSVDQLPSGSYQPTLAVLITIATALVLGCWFIKREHSYLSRLLGNWVVFIGIILLAFQISQFVTPIDRALTNLDNVILQPLCKNSEQVAVSSQQPPKAEASNTDSATSGVACQDAINGIVLYGARLLVLMGILWVLVFGLTLVVGIFTSVMKNQLSKTPNIVLPSIMLMTILWILTIASLWYSVGQLPIDVLPPNDLIYSGLSLVPVAFVCFLLTILAALFVSLRKSALKNLDDPKNYLLRTKFYSEKYRLIVGGILSAALFICAIIMIAAVFVSVMDASTTFRSTNLADQRNFANIIMEFIRNYADVIVKWVGIVGILVVSTVAGATKAGLEILKDVIIYINNYSWDLDKPWELRPREDIIEQPGLEQSTLGGLAGSGSNIDDRYKRMTFVEQVCSLCFGKKARTGYYLRDRIRDRFKKSVDELIEHTQPDELIFIAHSQGTVVVLDVLDSAVWEFRTRMENLSGHKPIIKLVTMGSPYTHIHHTYFPSSFESIAHRANLQRVSRKKANGNSGGGLNDWTNIFRVDDFVGTAIDMSSKNVQQWPLENPIKAGGHTNYWIDSEVAKIIRGL